MLSWRAVVCAVAVAVAVAVPSRAAYLPVVMMHGVTGSVKRMAYPVEWVHEALGNDTYVKNVEIGNGAIDSVFWNMNKQVDSFAESVLSDPKLRDGFNLIGYSQGGLITRGFVERYGHLAKIHNYITWSGPHGGVYGVPDNAGKFPGLVSLFDKLLDGGLTEWIQDHLSFASYWRDPFALSQYVSDSVFLADINNVRAQKNATYAANVAALNHWTLLYSTVDKIVIPRESGVFGAFAAGSNSTVVPLQQQQLWTDDWIGLRRLDARSALSMHATDCEHHNYPEPVCRNWFDLYTLPLLNGTYDDLRASRERRGLDV